jgi:hypothetical protein
VFFEFAKLNLIKNIKKSNSRQISLVARSNLSLSASALFVVFPNSTNGMSLGQKEKNQNWMVMREVGQI